MSEPVTTDERAKLLEAIFDHGGSEAKFTSRGGTYQGKPAVFLECGAMYRRPSYKGEGGLVGMLNALMAIGGGNMIAEYDETNSGGCDTCDYGSFYAVEFVVWTEPKQAQS